MRECFATGAKTLSTFETAKSQRANDYLHIRVFLKLKLL